MCITVGKGRGLLKKFPRLIFPLLLVVVIPLTFSDLTLAQGGYDLAQLRAERRAMAQRERRIIMNNDGDEIVYSGIDTRQEFLDKRTTALLGSQVDTISYYSTWGMKLHHSGGPFGQLYSAPDPSPSTQNYLSILAETGLGIKGVRYL